MHFGRWAEGLDVSAEESAFNLGVTRILFFSFVFLTMSIHDYFLGWTSVPDELWHPRGIFRFFDQPLSRDFISYCFHFWRWLGVLCIFGVFFRLLAPIWWILGLVVVTNAHSFGHQSHVFMPIVLAGLPLCFSRASDRLSLDSWRGWTEASLDQRVYSVPLRSLQLVFVLVYFAAGISKLRTGGWRWIAGDTLRNYSIRASWLFSDANLLAHLVGLNDVLVRYPRICNALAFGAVSLELSVPLAFVWRKWSYVIIPMIVLLQIGIFFTIYVRFTPYVVLIVPWVNWWWLNGKIVHHFRSVEGWLR